MRIRPYYLRSLASFEAPDPWRGLQSAAFTLEEYVMGAAANPPLVDPEPGSLWVRLADHRYAIQAQPPGRVHFVPNFLFQLIRSKQVALEDVPRILHGLEPQLRKPSDYYDSSFSFVRRWGNRLIGAVLLCGLTDWMFVNPLARKDLILLAVLTLAICGPIEFVYQRRAWRHAQQKRWVLEQAGRSGASTTSS